MNFLAFIYAAVSAEVLLYPCCSPNIKQGLNDTLYINCSFLNIILSTVYPQTQMQLNALFRIICDRPHHALSATLTLLEISPTVALPSFFGLSSFVLKERKTEKEDEDEKERSLLRYDNGDYNKRSQFLSHSPVLTSPINASRFQRPDRCYKGSLDLHANCYVQNEYAAVLHGGHFTTFGRAINSTCERTVCLHAKRQRHAVPHTGNPSSWDPSLASLRLVKGLWTGGGRMGEWVVVGSAAGLVSWLVGRSERANAAPCASSLYLDDKEPNLTQWNGRMVMETAFNLHRRSLFVDSLKVGVLLARSGPLASLFALYFASLHFAMKRALMGLTSSLREEAQGTFFPGDRENWERVEENIVIFHRENRRLFAQGNQATSNEPIIKWNCLRSYGSRGGRIGQSGWAWYPPSLSQQ
ncbi:hypothetical protein ALC53_05720 [Atta colombica]|uniref:Uncharacterized protein n=1 Tax=Atta colombica TaxID=520822 RepID=A0A195BI01_9HYME|nr:hypothetical protein ALC53_05720 [Atta colombica]